MAFREIVGLRFASGAAIPAADLPLYLIDSDSGERVEGTFRVTKRGTDSITPDADTGVGAVTVDAVIPSGRFLAGAVPTGSTMRVATGKSLRLNTNLVLAEPLEWPVTDTTLPARSWNLYYAYVATQVMVLARGYPLGTADEPDDLLAGIERIARSMLHPDFSSPKLAAIWDAARGSYTVAAWSRPSSRPRFAMPDRGRPGIRRVYRVPAGITTPAGATEDAWAVEWEWRNANFASFGTIELERRRNYGYGGDLLWGALQSTARPTALPGVAPLPLPEVRQVSQAASTTVAATFPASFAGQRTIVRGAGVAFLSLGPLATTPAWAQLVDSSSGADVVEKDGAATVQQNEFRTYELPGRVAALADATELIDRDGGTWDITAVEAAELSQQGRVRVVCNRVTNR